MIFKKRTLVLNKIFGKVLNFLKDTLAKISQNVSAYILMFQNILSIFFMLRKKLAFLSGGGGRPTPFSGLSSLLAGLLKNASFFYVLP